MPASPTPPTAGRRNAKQDAIRQAAMRVFLRHGYAGTSVDAILAEAGVSRQTLYNHFGGKEGLFRAVVQDVLDQVLGTLADQVEETALGESDDLEADLTRLGTTWATVMLQPHVLALRRLVIGESTNFPTSPRPGTNAAPNASSSTCCAPSAASPTAASCASTIPRSPSPSTPTAWFSSPTRPCSNSARRPTRPPSTATSPQPSACSWPATPPPRADHHGLTVTARRRGADGWLSCRGSPAFPLRSAWRWRRRRAVCRAGPVRRRAGSRRSGAAGARPPRCRRRGRRRLGGEGDELGAPVLGEVVRSTSPSRSRASTDWVTERGAWPSASASADCCRGLRRARISRTLVRARERPPAVMVSSTTLRRWWPTARWCRRPAARRRHHRAVGDRSRVRRE